jgi:hypothetical protein
MDDRLVVDQLVQRVGQASHIRFGTVDYFRRLMHRNGTHDGGQTIGRLTFGEGVIDSSPVTALVLAQDHTRYDKDQESQRRHLDG